MELNPQFSPLPFQKKKSFRFTKKAAATQFSILKYFSFPPIKTSPFPFSSTRFNNSCITEKKNLQMFIAYLYLKPVQLLEGKQQHEKKPEAQKTKFISTKLISNPEKRFMRFYGA